jgi:hypothetical protein
MIVYTARLDGPSEDPPNASPGMDFARVSLDLVAHLLEIEAFFSNLIGTTTVAHIHAPTAVPVQGNIGVAVTPGTLPGFPVGVASGSYSTLLDTLSESTYTTNFLNNFGGGTAAGAEAALAASLAACTAYFNIHSNVFPGGEIRGFL